jgi:hypothetical protein
VQLACDENLNDSAVSLDGALRTTISTFACAGR